jgi:hypothetical protein
MAMHKVLDFIKKHRFDILVTCSVLAFIWDLFFYKHTFTITIICLYVLGYATDSERSANNEAERKILNSKGLTNEDLDNIKFVKRWEETRKKGLIKYSLVDGGVFFGFALCGIISILALIIKKNIMSYISADPSNMFNFVSYTYVAGIIGGTVLYRLLWTYKENKFIRLTDPLH